MQTSSGPAMIHDMRTRQGVATFDALQKHRRVADASIQSAVVSIVEGVRTGGDAALFDFAHRFDGVSLTPRTVRLDPLTFKKRGAGVPVPLRKSIREAARRIREYHRHQGRRPYTIRTPEGVLSQIVTPLRRVGIYVPGGHTVYPSTVLMNAIPARLAGVRDIVAVTPCRGGELDPLLAFVFDLLSIREVYATGGAHAIAALAFGTPSIPRVDKIAGPGNAWVAAAKRLVFGDVDIDMIAGPSDVAILADAQASPRLIALDMLAQAEHGSGDESAVCITWSARLARSAAAAVTKEVQNSPCADLFAALKPGALSVCMVKDKRAAFDLANTLAPEHLQIMTQTARKDLALVENAGAVFVGEHSPVAAGDYFVGTNHVLPTGGCARFASGLGVDDFQKRISVAQLSARGVRACAGHVSCFARAEGFVHHALSMEQRVHP